MALSGISLWKEAMAINGAHKLNGVPAVNAWTQWGKLEKVVVGRADPTSCHLPHEPANHAEINDVYLAERIPWPGGNEC